MKVAAIQLASSGSKDDNVSRAVAQCEAAIAQKAQFIALPEVFSFCGSVKDAGGMAAVAETIPGPTIATFAALAKKRRVFILVGSIFERSHNKDKAYNTSVLIDPTGKIISRYRKMHLFEAVLNGKHISEATRFLPGTRRTVSRVGPFTVGMCICYDLRFPEFFAWYARQGVDVLCAPSAFTYRTGSAHWEILVRSRAVEMGSYVIGPNQVGETAFGITQYGNSMIVDPWGQVCARASEDTEEIIYAEISVDEIKKSRARLPGYYAQRKAK
jgi:deaminated glutathione amidase